jgi:serine/threonine protein kinase
MLKGLFKGKKDKPGTSGGSAKPASPAKPAAPVKAKRNRVNIDRRFKEIALTAQGSMSKVCRALDTKTGRSVCLKVQNTSKTVAAAARASQEARPSEGEIGMKITHPHIVRTFEHGESTRGDHWVSMEFIDGVSLNYVRQSRGASLAEKLELLAQAAEALATVHKAGYIHHDIGPKNFLVDRNNQVKMIDFGLAVPNTPVFNRPGNRTGTLQYMAPELIRRETTDERIDIFAFGVMAYELLTNRLPYEATGDNQMAMMLQRINSEPLDPHQANPDLPAPLCDLIRTLIARRKDQRRRAMAGLAEEFREIAAQFG